MDEKDKLNELILDPGFQKLLENWSNTSPEERSRILLDFDLTNAEMEELYLVWSALHFKRQSVPLAEIEAELAQTVWKIEQNEQAKARYFDKSRMLQLFSRVAAVLLIPVLVYTTYLFFKTPGVNPIDSKLQLITVESQPGTQTNVVLPDGTKVWLNSGSTVSYPSQFTGSYRDVAMTGEAYFEVVKNKDFPMVVAAGNFNVRVYGTKFNINAYPVREVAHVTLLEGSISLTGRETVHNRENEIMMKPGQTASIYSGKKEVILETKDPFLFTAWKDGLIVFKNANFEEVLERLARKFNVRIELKDNSLKSIPLDATFKDENLNEILRLMSLSIPFDFYYGKDKELSDGSFAKSTIYIVSK